MVHTPGQGRLEAHRSQQIDRSKTVGFEFNGKLLQAFEGDTVGSALYAAGVRIYTRSLKYHRPRGLFCVAGTCPNCLMTIDGVPNVPACNAPVREGMSVRQQNAWPSVDHDLFSIMDQLDRLLPIGFYYKTFHTPKLFWKAVRPIIRWAAGLGSVPKGPETGPDSHHEYRHTDVAVVGGGPAGMSAALAAAAAGARVTLIDEQPALGGRLRYDSRRHEGLADLAAATGFEVGRSLAQSVTDADGIEVLSGAGAFGLYEGNLLGIVDGGTTVKLRAKAVVVATGSQETPLTFDGNDLPGVMLSTALQRLIHQYGVRPGSTAIVATTNDQGYHAAVDLLGAGIRVVAVIDSRPEFPAGLDAALELQASGILILTSHAMTRAEGVRKLVGGVAARLVDGRITTEERQFDADIIAVSGGFQPAAALLRQLGTDSEYDAGLDEAIPANLPPALYAAGDVTGIHDVGVAILQGRMAGMEAAADLGKSAGPDVSELRRRQTDAEAVYRRKVTVAPPPVDSGVGAKQFVCLCEDVTARDIMNGVDEGFADIQTLKRYSTVTMGPCQGKTCHKAFVDISAKRAGRSIDEMGGTTARPPVQPVSLGALAGPSHMPIKRTPVDRRHRELGGTMIDSNMWQRPQMYRSPQEEALAVRNGVGIIDVSTLGKLDVIGKDAPALLDKLYTHHFSTLRVGRVRYAVLCSDTGSIMDDGTIARLADDHYFVTTSTASVELIEEWYKWWMAGTGMCAHVTNITAGLAAFNVAGPKARDTLSKLTDLDLSTKGFRYMRSRRGDVAGVPTTLLRIGFVGESGWELHFPSEKGEYLWDAIMDAGKEFGIAPFGTETQRILRLEKKHIIANQDTDLLSNPLDSDMSWVVRFDKDDFIGRGGLVAAREQPQRSKLVGFVMRNGAVPHDGDAVVSGFVPVGRVTSSRLSPTMGKGFGFAWVPMELAEEGKTIHIRVDGRTYPAGVTMEPFYDPDGKRLRG
jgi:sarcosine oxidase subunit alpha